LRYWERGTRKEEEAEAIRPERSGPAMSSTDRLCNFDVKLIAFAAVPFFTCRDHASVQPLAVTSNLKAEERQEEGSLPDQHNGSIPSSGTSRYKKKGTWRLLPALSAARPFPQYESHFCQRTKELRRVSDISQQRFHQCEGGRGEGRCD
jgi:hypothetical protein